MIGLFHNTHAELEDDAKALILDKWTRHINERFGDQKTYFCVERYFLFMVVRWKVVNEFNDMIWLRKRLLCGLLTKLLRFEAFRDIKGPGAFSSLLNPTLLTAELLAVGNRMLAVGRRVPTGTAP